MKSWEVDHTFAAREFMSAEDSSFATDDNKSEVLCEGGSDSEADTVPKQLSSNQWDEDLSKALRMFDFKGSFLETERYSLAQASNPCLEIDGIGLIGLPLSAHDAKTLLADPSDPAVNRLEIPGENVHFTNPAWNTWFKKEAGSVCTALSGKGVKPVYSLKKLVLEGPEAQIPSGKTIATLVVVLPSLFEGGDMLFDHGIQSTTVHLASQGQLLTSIVAAYSVVKRNLCAITSGYRLSLHYDVHQPVSDSLSIPSFPDVYDAVLALRQAMVGWKEDKTRNSAQLLACFLRRKYTWEEFTSLQALAGPDALLMAHLSRLAKELDYQLYFVQVNLFVTKWGHYDGPWRSIKREAIEDVELVDTWPPFTRERAFDMNGIPVTITGFDFMHGPYINGEFDDVEPENEYDMEGTGVRIDETYQRTLFLLWPTSNDSEKPVKVGYHSKK
ncbi:hypothetical protein FB451DRAFT_1285302 [Mycena latifolia]|nr:hypothetical protein FB451DRAFT_1285302 [Mycena latifolia]